LRGDFAYNLQKWVWQLKFKVLLKKTLLNKRIPGKMNWKDLIIFEERISIAGIYIRSKLLRIFSIILYSL